MNSEELNTLLNSINEKLGEENSALISDDLGNLITKNTEVFNTLSNKEKESGLNIMERIIIMIRLLRQVHKIKKNLGIIMD